MARPRKGETRVSRQARLPVSFLDMAQRVADYRGVPVGDVIASAGRDRIERAYRRIEENERSDTGHPVA